MRVGGFGGTDGLVGWLAEHPTDLIVDATHPFAARMSAHAFAAALATGVRLLALRRPPWTPIPGDRWVEVATVADAGQALTHVACENRRVFATIGRQELAALLAAAPESQPWLVRAIEPVDHLIPPGQDVRVVLARGPFLVDDELRLMIAHDIGALVSKNAGGSANAAKLVAARHLGLPVVMVQRPDKPLVPAMVDSAAAALAWIARHAATTRRGV